MLRTAHISVLRGHLTPQVCVEGGTQSYTLSRIVRVPGPGRAASRAAPPRGTAELALPSSSHIQQVPRASLPQSRVHGPGGMVSTLPIHTSNTRVRDSPLTKGFARIIGVRTEVAVCLFGKCGQCGAWAYRMARRVGRWMGRCRDGRREEGENKARMGWKTTTSKGRLQRPACPWPSSTRCVFMRLAPC